MKSFNCFAEELSDNFYFLLISPAQSYRTQLKCPNYEITSICVQFITVKKKFKSSHYYQTINILIISQQDSFKDFFCWLKSLANNSNNITKQQEKHHKQKLPPSLSHD